MKIIVPIKQVPETKSVKMDETTGTVIREGVENIVNPLDLYAIETAVVLKERYGGKVVAVTMGPPKAVEALKEAVAMGADSGLLITDRVFAGSDTWSTAYVLGEAIKTLGEYSLIICGERATDGDTGQVGPMLAQYLGLPVTTYINKVKEIKNNRCRLHRLVEDGTEKLEVDMPCLLTVVKEVGEPRLPTLNGKLKAKNMEIPVLGMDELKLDLELIGLKGSPTKVVKTFRPKVTRECEKIIATDEESIAEATAKFADFLGKNI